MNKSNVMKNIIFVLSILMIVMILVQVGLMFVPYYEVTPPHNPWEEEVPTAQNYSLQEYMWTATEDMNASITKPQIEQMLEAEKSKPKNERLKEKDIKPILYAPLTENLENLVLVDLFALVALIMLLLELKHLRSKYVLASGAAWKVLSHVMCLVWSIYSILNYLSASPMFNGALTLSVAHNTGIADIIAYVSIGALVLEVIRLVLAFVGRTRYKVINPEM